MSHPPPRSCNCICQAAGVSSSGNAMGNSAGQWYMLKSAAQARPIMSLLHHSHGMCTAAANRYTALSLDSCQLWPGKRLCILHDSMVHATHSSCSSAMVSLESGRSWFVTTITPTSDMCETAASACCRVKLLAFSLLKCLMVPAANANRRKLRLVQSSTTCVQDDAMTSIQASVSENLAG